MHVLAVLVAAQLSATDLRDVRCAYVFEQIIPTKSAEDRDTAKWLQQWFHGRLSVSQPTLNVLDYATAHFKKVPVAEADFEQCSNIYMDWARQQLMGSAK